MVSQREKREQRKKLSGRKRAEEHKSGFETKCFKLPDGKRLFTVKQEGVKRIDIIPYEVPEGVRNPNARSGELHMERTYYAHRDVGPDGDMYPCLKKTFNKPCPICDYRASMLKDPDADEDLVKSMAPKERQLWNVFDHDEPERGVQIWDVSFHLFGKQLDARVLNSDEEDNYEFYADPVDGMTLKVGFKEESFGRGTFYTTSTLDFKARKTPLSDELLEQALVLDSLLTEYKYDQLKEVFLQTAESDEDEPIREPKKKGKPPVEEEVEEEEPDEDVDEDEDNEEEELEEDDEEQEAEDEEEEEEEEEAPKSKKASAATAAKTSSPPTKSTTTAKTASPSKSKPSPKTAKDFGIAVKDIVDHEEFGECEVVAISKDGSAVYVMDKKNKKHSVGPEELTKVEFEDDEPEEKEKPKAKSKPTATTSKGKGMPAAKEEEEEWDEDWDEEG